MPLGAPISFSNSLAGRPRSLPGNGIAMAELGQQNLGDRAQWRRTCAGDAHVQLHAGEEQPDHRAFDDDAIEINPQDALNARDGLCEDWFGLHAVDTPGALGARTSVAWPPRRVAAQCPKMVSGADDAVPRSCWARRIDQSAVSRS